ncbi:zinc-binding domain-containing protein [Cadophora sp. MPI-SDFR-AT-0126]|nr:zinc-binding domain-containing protein [Leotiomycetes sp. MPI-SDFR-AT-0126]
MSQRRPQRRPKRRPQESAWSMFPLLHENVSQLLEAENHPFTHDTTIMGRFRCRNKDCKTRGWSSKKIAITIRMYSGERYNARVYHQRCQSCNAISKPTLDDSYAERVAYRLLKWPGVEQELPEFSGKSNGPHQSELCEGCKAGHCSGSDQASEDLWYIIQGQ